MVGKPISVGVLTIALGGNVLQDVMALGPGIPSFGIGPSHLCFHKLIPKIAPSTSQDAASWERPLKNSLRDPVETQRGFSDSPSTTHRHLCFRDVAGTYTFSTDELRHARHCVGHGERNRIV